MFRSEYPNLVLKTASTLQQNGQLTDVTLNVKGREFKAHRVILASGSRFFERLFLGNYKEATQAIVNIDYDPEIFSRILQSIYGKDISFNLPGFILEKALIYFGVKGFDPERYLLRITVTPDKFQEYVQFVDTVYPEGIPNEIIDNIAAMINTQTDISFLSDDFITHLLLSPKYEPRSIQEIYELIKGLVEKGHSSELLSLINYDRFPQELRSYFTEDFLRQYNKHGSLPRLTITDDLLLGMKYATLLIAETPKPFPESSGGYFTKFIDGSGKIWDGEVKGALVEQISLGNIIRGYSGVESSIPSIVGVSVPRTREYIYFTL